MTLTVEPNRTTPSSLRKGMTGWPVYALQHVLAELGFKTAADGDFGSETELAVGNFQRREGLTTDALAGPYTQARLCLRVARLIEPRFSVPAGLLRSLMDGESGNMLGAVNWSVPGGVDVGVLQRRVYGPPYDVAKLRRAYAPTLEASDSIAELEKRAGDYQARPAVQRKPNPREYALRLAILAHNWPFAAEELSRGRQLADRDATWIPEHLTFPDGAPVRTWTDWAEFYAMGSTHGEARMVRYVVSWA